MAVPQRKVSLIAEFLEESFVGCSVHDQEDENHVAKLYHIVDDTTGKLLHRVIVSRAFLKDHTEAEIVPALQNLCLLVCLRMAAGRRVIVRSQMIVIEEDSSRLSRLRDTQDLRLVGF
jgi:hypothetical protein